MTKSYNGSKVEIRIELKHRWICPLDRGNARNAFHQLLIVSEVVRRFPTIFATSLLYTLYIGVLSDDLVLEK
jgi:hypothetical protein